MRATFSAVFALGVLGLAGCQGPDVGQACTIQAVGEVDLNKTSVPADFFESGNLSCDNLVCIKSPDQSAGSKVKSNPYCSKACVSNSDCFESDTPQETQDQYQLLLGQISFSSYCAAPLQ